MASNELFDKLQKLYSENPQGVNIIEEQIDLDIQMNYFKRSSMLKKQVVSFDDIILKVPTLYDPEARLEEKRDILVYLASFENVEAFRIIEKFKNDAIGEIKLWAAMAYRESKMLIESSFLDEDQILISTGLGGKGTNLRYFVCFVHKNEEPFNEINEKIIRGELIASLDKHNGELESLQFENQIAKGYILVPINETVKSIIDDVYDASVELGDFLDEHLILTNVKTFSDAEILDIVNGRMHEDDALGIDDFDGLPFYDIDADEEDEDDEDDNDEEDDEDDF